MPFLRSPPPGMRIDLVKAERSDRWQPQVVAELAGVDKLVGVHVLPDAGHWVHVVRKESDIWGAKCENTLGCYV